MFIWLSMENVAADGLPLGMPELTQVSNDQIHADVVGLFQSVIVEMAGPQEAQSILFQSCASCCICSSIYVSGLVGFPAVTTHVVSSTKPTIFNVRDTD